MLRLHCAVEYTATGPPLSIVWGWWECLACHTQCQVLWPCTMAGHRCVQYTDWRNLVSLIVAHDQSNWEFAIITHFAHQTHIIEVVWVDRSPQLWQCTRNCLMHIVRSPVKLRLIYNNFYSTSTSSIAILQVWHLYACQVLVLFTVCICRAIHVRVGWHGQWVGVHASWLLD